MTADGCTILAGHTTGLSRVVSEGMGGIGYGCTISPPAGARTQTKTHRDSPLVPVCGTIVPEVGGALQSAGEWVVVALTRHSENMRRRPYKHKEWDFRARTLAVLAIEPYSLGDSQRHRLRILWTSKSWVSQS